LEKINGLQVLLLEKPSLENGKQKVNRIFTKEPAEKNLSYFGATNENGFIFIPKISRRCGQAFSMCCSAIKVCRLIP
jgi:hypothetical protein